MVLASKPHTTKHDSRAREHPPQYASGMGPRDCGARRSGRSGCKSLSRSGRAASAHRDRSSLRKGQCLTILHRSDHNDVGLSAAIIVVVVIIVIIASTC